MLTEIITGAACICIILLVYAYFVMMPKQRELTERARLSAARYSAGNAQSNQEFDLNSILTNPVVQQILAGLIKKE